MKKATSLLVIAILSGVFTLTGYKLLIEKEPVVVEKAIENRMPVYKTNFIPTVNNSSAPTGFTEAADKTVHAVVHVKNTSIRTQFNPLEYFFGNGNGERRYQQIGTGSGVIISPDGYIVTNNHVVQGATDIEITLNNNKSYPAKLIGTDSENDIALVKIEADEDLPYIPFGNSDAIKIGEWVLAVGNPYNLTSTVTAGIVSAKGRDLEGNGNIESFIQTDAAVNSGNSGGALVNTRGELIGINTAITSRTGSFIGYSFAVPSNIAKKVIEDIMEFGAVQEALIGITYSKEDNLEGVTIQSVTDGGGAIKAGLKKGDIITKINQVKIKSFADLKGQLSAKRPGDVIRVTLLRDGNEIVKHVTLTKNELITVENLFLLADVTKSDLKKFTIESGAKIVQLTNPYLKYYGITEGCIITKINKQKVKNAKHAKRLIFNKGNDNVYVDILNKNGELLRIEI